MDADASTQSETNLERLPEEFFDKGVDCYVLLEVLSV